jgi:hypothetical protein
MDKKKLSIVLAAAAVATGAAIGITGLTGGAAHAQSSSSISITGMAQTGPTGNPQPQVLVSVTCPAGSEAEVSATATQGAYFDGQSSEFACTGSPQNEVADVIIIRTTTSDDSGFMSAGPVLAGASLWIGGQPFAQYVGTTATVTYP